MEQYKDMNGFDSIEDCIYEIVSDTLYVGRYGDINNKITSSNVFENTEVKDMTPKKVKEEVTLPPPKVTNLAEKQDVVKTEETQTAVKTENKVRTRKRTIKAK